METRNNLGLEVNKQQLLNLLSASLYKGDILQVSTRELLQNAFDAVKAAKNNAPIEVTWISYNNTLRIKDAGIGMSPATVQKVFLTIGGTAKEGLAETDRSGGFGIAKVQFFMAASTIKVETVHNGILTVLECTKEDLLNEQASLTITHTDAKPGTTVTLTFPDEYYDGAITKRAHYRESSITSVLKHPLLGWQIDTKFNGRSVQQDHPARAFSYEFDWGTAIVYPEKYIGESYSQYHYHCAGLYQFLEEEYTGDNLGMSVRVNILPKYPAGHNLYPFANSRDSLAHIAAKDIDPILKSVKEIGKKMRSLSIAAEYNKFMPLEYTKGCTKSIASEMNPNFDVNSIWQTALENAMSISDFIACLEKALEAKNKREKTDRENHDSNKDNSLKLINKKNISVNSDLYNACCNLASVVYDVIYDSNIRKYVKPTTTIAGIVFEKGTSGCCLTLGGIIGVYLNPLGKYCNAEHFASNMMDTLVHELAHATGYDYHGDSFFGQERAILNEIHFSNLYASILESFRDIYQKHGKAFNV